MSSESPTVDDVIAEHQTEMVSAMNVEYSDSVLLVARILGGHRSATEARATSIDAAGVDFVVVDPDGEHEVRVDFAEPVTDAELVLTAVLETVVRARAESGEEGTTSAEKLLAGSTGYRTFITEVVSTEEITPTLRQVTFSGDDLATFSPVGPDTFLYVLLPPPGRAELTIDTSFSWEAVPHMPEDERPVGAYYTLRRWRPEAREIDVWAVRHEGAGPAGRWFEEVTPGAPAALWGPRTAFEPPPDTDGYLLVADETGLPAVAVILESLPAGVPIVVLAEADSPATRPPLPEHPTATVHWLHREGAAPGTTTLLGDAARTVNPPGARPYVWGGGESRAMTAVRKHVRHELGLAREHVSLVAYWRHQNHVGDPPDEE